MGRSWLFGDRCRGSGRLRGKRKGAKPGAHLPALSPLPMKCLLLCVQHQADSAWRTVPVLRKFICKVPRVMGL